jgi:hypothetical protein
MSGMHDPLTLIEKRDSKERPEKNAEKVVE